MTKLKAFIQFEAAANKISNEIISDFVTNTKKSESINPLNFEEILQIKFYSSILLSFECFIGFFKVYFMKKTINKIKRVCNFLEIIFQVQSPKTQSIYQVSS